MGCPKIFHEIEETLENTCPISLQCQVLGVKRSAYYQYIARQTSHKEDKNHQEILEWIEDIAESSDHTYGSRRIKKTLNILGYPVSRIAQYIRSLAVSSNKCNSITQRVDLIAA
ncbi:MAG: hypothetical protein KZQ66_08940 [Candidatus Thiodiazotropha sp. (ex Lucinoma aequizonata)]|nr:hypothetical protein [Candidatus Thiodiazotropha sp. (ex Lucinoma aequizonata)]